jgi:hypothetical protein
VGLRACGLAGLLKAQGARLERRGEAPNLQKPPREELKPQARWRAKGRECVRENTPVLFHNPSVVGASQSPPKTCGRAAARRSKANTVTPRAQSRREDCSVADAAATVLLLLPLHLSSVESLSRNSPTPHAEHRKSAQAGGLLLVSLHRPPAAIPAFHRDTGILSGWGARNHRTHSACQQAWRPGSVGGRGEARGGEGRAAPLLQSKQL